MLKTLAPEQIPNGTIGTVIGDTDLSRPGLYLVEFDIGYVYRSEIEVVQFDEKQEPSLK